MIDDGRAGCRWGCTWPTGDTTSTSWSWDRARPDCPARCAPPAWGSRCSIVEKSDVWGGSAAMSAGALWVPANAAMRAIGLEDSEDDAVRYLTSITHGEIDEARLRAFVTESNRMIDWLAANSHVDVHVAGALPRLQHRRRRRTSGRSLAGTGCVRRDRVGRGLPHAAPAVSGHADPRQVPDADPRGARAADARHQAEARPRQGLRPLHQAFRRPQALRVAATRTSRWVRRSPPGCGCRSTSTACRCG